MQPDGYIEGSCYQKTMPLFCYVKAKGYIRSKKRLPFSTSEGAEDPDGSLNHNNKFLSWAQPLLIPPQRQA